VALLALDIRSTFDVFLAALRKVNADIAEMLIKNKADDSANKFILDKNNPLIQKKCWRIIFFLQLLPCLMGSLMFMLLKHFFICFASFFIGFVGTLEPSAVLFVTEPREQNLTAILNRVSLYVGFIKKKKAQQHSVLSTFTDSFHSFSFIDRLPS
jgi:hypothetical protein